MLTSRRRQGLRGLARAARRIPGLHRPEHRADARGHAHERAAAEGHRAPREAAARRQVDGEPGGQRLLPPVSKIPCRIPAADRARLSGRGPRARARGRSSRPSRGCATSSQSEYLPACYDQVGWWQTSSGLAGYAYFARLYTTTDLTPQQIHEIGLKEVARIKAEMEQVKAEAGFTGTLAGVLHVPQDRPAVLLQDARRPARRLPRGWPSASIPSW